MRDFDFAGLREDATAAFRPQFTDVVRRAGRRKARTRTAGLALTAAAVTGATGVAMTAVPAGPVDPEPSTSASASVRTIYGTDPVAGSLDYLYQATAACEVDPAAARIRPPADVTFWLCRWRVTASGDRGHSWRTTDIGLATRETSVDVLAVNTTVVVRSRAVPAAYRVSVDAGATWRTEVASTVATLPVGWVPMPTNPDGFALRVSAVDPDTGRVAEIGIPLMGPIGGTLVRTLPSAGLWLTGWRRGTGASPEPSTTPAVGFCGVSPNGGRGWHMKDLGPGGTRPSGLPAVATSIDGRNAVLALVREGTVEIYRTHTAGATWERTPFARTVPDHTSVALLMLADGTVLMSLGSETYESADQGDTFTPSTAGPLYGAYPVPGGYAAARPMGVIISADGRSWTLVEIPQVS